MNGVSDITFLRPLSTQDKHICFIVIAAKKEKREEGKERREGRKYKNLGCLNVVDHLLKFLFHIPYSFLHVSNFLK